MSHISPEPFELTGSILSLAEVTSEHQQMNIFCLTVKGGGEISDLPPVLRDSDPVLHVSLAPHLHTRSLFLKLTKQKI